MNMKHLRKFEDADYRDKLASEYKARQDFEKAEEERMEQRRKELADKYADEMAEEKRKRTSQGDPVTERREIVHKVTDFLVKQLNNEPGYESFKEELLAFLNEFPKE